MSRHPTKVPETNLARGEPAWHRLSAFQQSMALWDEAHPYNAVHAVVLRGYGDPDRLRRAVGEVCEAAGIGDLVLDRRRGRYCYLHAGPVQIRSLVARRPLDEALEEEAGGLLNEAFPDQAHAPLRWVLLEDLERERHALILGYHHVVADAYAIELLLAAVLPRYLGTACESAAGSPHVPRAQDAARIGGKGVLPAGGRSLVRMVRQYFQLRHAHKMREARNVDDYTAARFLTWAASAKRMREAGRIAGAGLNDLCLAALACGLAELTPQRHEHRRRHRLALGTIVSHRKALGEPFETAFGAFLGPAVVEIPQPDAPYDEVLAAVRRCTARIAATRAGTAGSAMPFLVRHVWPVFGQSNCRQSYQKLFPLCGGVSSFVLAPGLFPAVGERIERYLRACPTGPAMPLVLSPTVWGDRLELGLVYRRSCLDADQAAELHGLITHRLDDFVERTLLSRPDGEASTDQR